MKKELFGYVDLKPRLKCEQAVVVEYFITTNDIDDKNYDSKKPYGIEVIKKQTVDGVVYKEIKTVNHVGESADTVNRLLNILHRNEVTPICVSDVLTDLSAI